MPYKDPAKRRANAKKYREDHREELRAYHKQWSAENPDKVHASHQQTYYKDLEHSRARGRANQQAKREKDPNAARDAEKKWRQANPEKVRAKKRRLYHRHRAEQVAAGEITPRKLMTEATEWTCSKCGETKPLQEFRRRSSTPSGYAQPCKVCTNQAAKDYARQNPDQARTWRAKNRQKVIHTAQKWQQEHPEKVRSLWASRRARKRNAWVEKVEYTVLYERDHGMCQLRIHKDCPGRITPKQGTFDHIVPLALGGEHSYRNMQLACRRCNFKKNKTGKGDQLRLF